ncbi:MAG: hypothetical protein KBB87_06245 [Candidatus Methanofastidiosum sp.]|jgi:DNA-binding transcriptional MerR regulator|nr:hypothetical protein [Methanofastidiosum sp.]MBP8707627.1 hypothetical protein [Caldisericia bacterium]
MTTKELAEKCSVSEQSIRAWCKRNNISKAPQGADNKLAYQITSDIENEILKYYGKEQLAKVTKSSSESEKSQISESKKLAKDEKEISESEENQETQEKKDENAANQLINELIRQLTEKDKQIQMIQEQNKILTESLHFAQENSKSLTDAIVAAQALHAATIQTTALVDNSAEQELKWWQRIFKKKEI